MLHKDAHATRSFIRLSPSKNAASKMLRITRITIMPEPFKSRPRRVCGPPRLNIVTLVLYSACHIDCMICVNFSVRPMPTSSHRPVATICTIPIFSAPPTSNRFISSTTAICAAQPKNAATGAVTSEAHQHSLPQSPFRQKNGTSSFSKNSRSKQTMAAAIRHSAKPMSFAMQVAVMASSALHTTAGVFLRGAKYSTSPAPNSSPIGISAYAFK